MGREREESMGREREESMGREREESVGTATPHKGSQEPKGRVQKPFHMVSTWFLHGSVELVYIEASPRLRKGDFFSPEELPPRNFLPFPLESVPSEQKFPRGPSLEKDISLLQENLCGISQLQFYLGST